MREGGATKTRGRGLSVNHQDVHLRQSGIKNPIGADVPAPIGQQTGNTKDGSSLTGEGAGGVVRSVGVGETATAEMSVGETEGRNNRSSARRYGRNGARQLCHLHSLTARELWVDAPPCPMTPAIALIGPTRAV